MLLLDQFLEARQQGIVLGAPVGRVVRIVDQPAPLLLEQAGSLGLDLGPQSVQFLDDREVAVDVLGPDRAGALEHHVLEQVSHPGNAGPLVDGPELRDPARGDVGIALLWKEQEFHAVAEGEFLDLDPLARERCDEEREAQKEKCNSTRHGVLLEVLQTDAARAPTAAR